MKLRLAPEKWLVLLGLTLLTTYNVGVVGRLFEPGYPSSWDGAAHFVRLSAMVEIFLPEGRWYGWCPYWYNGFDPFLFYPPFFFLLTALAHFLLQPLADLLDVFKAVSVAGYVLLPTAMYLTARAFNFDRLAAFSAALISSSLSAPHGIGIQALFMTGLFPQVFALPCFLVSLALFHRSIQAGGHWRPLAALAIALVLWTHTITSIALFLCLLVYGIVALRERQSLRQLLGRASVVLATAALVALAVVVPPFVHRGDLLGPGTGWGDFAFVPTLLRGHILGTVFSNALALWFLLLARKRSFEEKLLAAMAWLTFAFALGLVTTGIVPIDGALYQVLKHRALPYLGLILALLGGAACSRIREVLLRLAPRSVARSRLGNAVTALLVLAPLSWSGHRRIQELNQGPRVDSHYDNLEKRTYLDAYHWLRRFAPPHVVVGFDDRYLDFGDPGYNQMASRVVLEAERSSLPGNQIEATRAHNAEVLRHLADWTPDQIYERLVRYNLSYLITWRDDVERNLSPSPLFERVHRNARVSVWRVRGHPFVYARGRKLRIVKFHFESERLDWRVRNPGAATEILFSVSFHPYWEAFVDGSAVPLRETPDHLMVAGVPPGTHELALVFRRPGWRALLDFLSASAGLVCLVWAAHGVRLRRRAASGFSSPVP